MSQFETAIPNLRQIPKLTQSSQIETSQIVAGAVDDSNTIETVSTLHLAGERIWHHKALRHVCGVFPEINQWGVEFVGILLTWLRLHGRENVGGALDTVSDWSGARRRWDKRIKEGCAEAVAGGFVEAIPYGNGGYVYDITQKGRRMLQAYDRRYNEVKEDNEARAVVRALEREAKRLRGKVPKTRARRRVRATPGEG